MHLRTFLQLAMIFLNTFCDFNRAHFSHPNQEQLVINGHETMICTCTCKCAFALKSVAFSLMSLFNVVRSSYFSCEHYVPKVLVLLPGKTDIIYRSMWSAMRSLCERHDSTLNRSREL